MSQPPRTILIVPCFNEEHRLPLASLAAVDRDERSLKTIFVNDGSSDGTQALIERFCAERGPRFELHNLSRNSGKGEAVRQGLRRAIAQGCQFVGYWDADLATPLDELPDFEQVMTRDPQVHVVLGSRVRMLGRDIDRSFTRHIAGRAFATSASLALGLPVYDTQCGAKLLRVGPWLDPVLDQPFHSRWLFDIELLFRLRDALPCEPGTTFADALYEQPLRTWRDVHGSKVRPVDFFRAFVQLLQLRRRYGPPRA